MHSFGTSSRCKTTPTAPSSQASVDKVVLSARVYEIESVELDIEQTHALKTIKLLSGIRGVCNQRCVYYLGEVISWLQSYAMNGILWIDTVTIAII